MSNFYCDDDILNVSKELKNSEEFKDIYTVFAGGDDLFLIGPWNKIVDFAFF